MSAAAEDLFDRYLVGAATAEDLEALERLLTREPQMRRRFAEHVQWSALFAQALALRVKTAANVRRAAARPRASARVRGWRGRVWRLLVLAGATAACVMIAARLGLLRGDLFGPRPALRLARVEGRVRVATGAGSVLRAAVAGQALAAGSRVVTEGASARARLAYADGTTLQLLGDSDLRELAADGPGGRGKSVVLAAGELTADVAAQGRAQPMVLHTPHASLTVLGTRLKLVVAPEPNGPFGGTCVVVTRGSVRVRGKWSAEPVLVGERQYAVVAEHVALEAHPLPSGRRAFIEVGGRVVIEAEHCTERVNRSGGTWVEEGGLPGYGGAGYMRAAAQNMREDQGYAARAAELRYEIRFSTPGTYYFWVRLRSPGPWGDSLWYGLDGVGYGPRAGRGAAEWVWLGQANPNANAPRGALRDVGSGQHVLNLWVREGDACVDRLILSTDPDYTPAGVGPRESPLYGGVETARPPGAE
ncbi:MAG: FecR domain-containing protein [Kiritimatiellae bacterium]|nr:FecR domain-containing protein [Kiritimatiellia bacterium]